MKKKIFILPASAHWFHNRIARSVLLVVLLLTGYIAWSQTTFPFTIKNNSEYADSDLYVAIVGEDPVSKDHVWLNPVTNQILPMSSSYNTVSLPGRSTSYANCFFRLSEIYNRTFNMPGIIGCRVYISRGQQLYFQFFAPNGVPSGYSAPDKLNISDPNQGILYEYIELTNDIHGFFGNTSRVDAFQYPMGLELYGPGGYYQKAGDLKTKNEVVALFRQRVPAMFQGCVNDSNAIWAPTKQPDFFDGTASQTVPGAYVNYFQSYIDAIWEKYKNEDLVFYAGQAGTFKGRIENNQLKCKEIGGGFGGKTAIITGKPTTHEVFEGKGILAAGDTIDKVVQAQLTAAINRHVVDVTTPNAGLQNWQDTSKFYKTATANYYSWFWHLPGISINQLAYGFCYDDVADQSPSLHTAAPTHVIATFGGYAGLTCDSTAVVPHLSVNGGALQTAATAIVAAGDSVKFAPEPAGGSWQWTGPNGFSSTAGEVRFTNIQPAQAGTYTAVYRNACGTNSTLTFTITVTGNITPSDNVCSGAGPSAPGTSTPDYSWQAAGSANPVITFIPGVPIAGSTLVILYVKNSSGGYAGYVMDASGNTFTKSISAASGTPLTFYFTYRVGNTNTERNSGATPHTFTVGSCGSTNTNAPPSIIITSPAGGTVFSAPASVAITATATDSDGTITKVEFYNGNTKIGESVTYPYSFTWTGVAAGAYPLHAVATDNKGATTTAATVNITVTANTGNTAGCSGNGPVASGQTIPDYSYAIATNGNVNVNFIPGTPISGCNLAIFYYRIGTGGWMGYTMMASSTGFTASVPIAGGSAIQFYFTYRRSTGGPESNSSAAPHSYTVGDNCTAGARIANLPVAANQVSVTVPMENPLVTAKLVSGIELYPNPATDRLMLPATVTAKSSMVITDVSGRIIPVKMLDNRTIDVSCLSAGIYTLMFTSNGQKVSKKFVKK